MYDIESNAAMMGRNLKARLDARGFSIRRLAGMCGISQATVCRMLNGATGTSLGTWLIACNALGCGLEDLMKDNEEGGETK